MRTSQTMAVDRALCKDPQWGLCPTMLRPSGGTKSPGAQLYMPPPPRRQAKAESLGCPWLGLCIEEDWVGGQGGAVGWGRAVALKPEA